jgi:16S rRNA (guanine1207-N2)-methyltransferase
MEHYFSEKQTSVLSVKKIDITYFEKKFSFLTPNGVFSFGKIDKGSDLILNKAKIEKSKKVLDLGCGYGLIGIVIAKIYNAKVTMVDINERALTFATKNAKKNNVDVEIIKSDAFKEIKNKFDVILFNPPQHAGKKLCFSMIEDSKKYLEKDGSLQVVARHNKGGKHIQEHMQNVFGNVEKVAIKSGFRIYISFLQEL